MKEELLAIGKGIPELACDLLSIVCPQFAVAKSVAEFFASFPNLIFADKLSRVLSNNEDFFEWLKIVKDFEKDSKNYQDAVRQVVYNIHVINEIKLLDVFANLMHAYKMNLIDEEIFYRLGWILSNAFADDLVYLKKCYGKKRMTECPELMSLERQNLVYKNVVPMFNGVVENNYTITSLGIKMLSCGVDYENYGKYQETNAK